MKQLLLITQFLTRLPIPFQFDASEEDFAAGISYFTIVGALLGGLLVLVAHLLLRLQLSVITIASFLTVFHIFQTGGLHLDGVADTSDGLFSNRPAARMLEIMKDSRIGSNGVLALIIVILFKLIGLTAIVEQGDLIALLAMPMAGRLSVVWAFFIGETPRQRGMGNLFIGKASMTALIINVLAVLLLIVFNLRCAIPIALSVLYSWGVVRWSSAKIGGITGDVLGFIIETSEVIYAIVTLMLYQLI